MPFRRRVVWTLAAAGFAAAVVTARGWPPLRGRFEIVHSSPVFQDITRVAFLSISLDGQMTIHFSTLESYSRSPRGDQFLLVSYQPASGRATADAVAGSPEARAYAFVTSVGRYVLGTSLNPRLLLYDPARGTVDTIFRGPRSTAFNHRLAVSGDKVYTILSTPKAPVPGFGGILEVDVRTRETHVIPFADTMSQGWGGVETVDPTGRVWFYRAYPFRQMWYDSADGMRDRVLAEYPGWTVESWDMWDGVAYVMLSNIRGDFIKRPVDLNHPDRGARASAGLASDSLFLESVPLDLYHNGDPALKGLYYRPSSASFYRREAERDVLTRLGSADLGQFQVMGFHHEPQEVAVRWLHPVWGEVEVLGLSPRGELVVWLRGRKTYVLVDVRSGSMSLHTIDFPNRSPAEITSLALGRDGALYGGGMLTMSHLFRVDANTRSSEVLKGAVPTAEGQVNALFAGIDGRLYGAGYPDAVVFRFDPGEPWRPGQSAESNPLNLGPMGHHHQTRVGRGVQALDGAVWFQSVSDYAFPIVHALVKADFDARTLVVKTDLDDGLPIVDDLAVLDARHLVLLGSQGGRPGLYALDEHTFRVDRSLSLPRSGGVLANLAPGAPGGGALLLAQGRNLYLVHPNLSLEHLHRSTGDIDRILAGEGREVILIGRRFIERFYPETRTARLWWRGVWWERFLRRQGSKPGGYLFRHLSWTPVVFTGGAVMFADEEKLWSFQPRPN